jgi:hypothetical protein
MVEHALHGVGTPAGPAAKAVAVAVEHERVELGRRDDAGADERDELVRYVVNVLTRDGRALRLPYAFDRKTHAVWVAERLQSLLDERRAALPYR